MYPPCPVLQNIKGANGRACRVVGWVSPPVDANVLFQYLGSVAKGYQVTRLPSDRRQYRSLVRCRFRTGVSLTGCEARHLALQLGQDDAPPLPYQVLFLSICHLAVLIYSSSLRITTKEWRIWGMIHVVLMHPVFDTAKNVAHKLCIVMGWNMFSNLLRYRYDVQMRQRRGILGLASDSPT